MGEKTIKKKNKRPQNLPDFEKKKDFNSPDFYDKFQFVAKNIKGFFLFLFILSYQVCSQIWLNYFVNDPHFGYITKTLNETSE